MVNDTSPAELHRLLLVAFHFPPIQGSSGVHRTLAFARYLHDFEWATTVLTASTTAYPRVSDQNEDLTPSFVDVVRAPALDTLRHLSIRGRYARWMALPDRWQSWIPGAIYAGLRTIRRQRPAVIMSTFPIASAHAIGLALSRLSGLPWVADFRDPMDQITYPKDPSVRRTYRWIEEQAFTHAARIVVTTPGTAEYYSQRYGKALATKIRIIPNGFDQETFPEGFDADTSAAAAPRSYPLTFVHSGILYPKERNPEPFLRALARLRDSGRIKAGDIKVVFRGSAHEKHFLGLVRDLHLEDSVSFPSALPYREAITEMLTADALLVFQDEGCNSQIPAKVYEYLYSGRPIIGITDPNGDTGKLLKQMSDARVAKLEDENAIFALLGQAVDELRAGTFPLPDRMDVMALSRRHRSSELAKALNELVATAAPSRIAHNYRGHDHG